MKLGIETAIIAALFCLGAQAQASGFSATKLPNDLKAIERSCGSLPKTDYLICPEFSAYKFNGTANDLLKKTVLADLADEDAKALKEASKETASGIIGARLVQQGSAFSEGDEGTFTKRQISKAQSLAPKLANFVTSWSKNIFAVKDTYWAPSVNSSTVILVDVDAKLVIVIKHGDTDG